MKPEPGYKLDWLMAEKVMGWTQEKGAWLDSDGRRCGYTYRWEPSRDIAAAWHVVERLAVENYRVWVRHQEEKWFCSIEPLKPGMGFPDYACFKGEALTAPYAICLAVWSMLESK